ncbi:MAG TPA: hypothetical protein VG148_13605 [Pyrinomonadaceae bacterium]|nr:hypothetical protein [Pyrinomonadaceae bacterium]
MTDKTGDQWDVHRLRYAAIGLEMVLDRRQETITFRIGRRPGADDSGGAAEGVGAESLTIRFRKFGDFERDLDSFSGRGGNGPVKALGGMLEALTESRDMPPSGLWRDTLGYFGFSLLRYSRKRRSELEAVAQKLLGWIGAVDVKTAWHTSFDQTLSFEHRYNLMREARHALAAGGDGRADGVSPSDMLEVRERELFWWSTLRMFESASEWQRQEGHHNINARRALRESSTAYLQMLKDEPRRRDLARFLAECGTDVEGEVKRVLFAGEKGKKRPQGAAGRSEVSHRGAPQTYNAARRRDDTRQATTGGDGVVGDEVIRRTFFVWFLKRYDSKSAKRLILSIPPAGENVTRARRLLIGLNVCAAIIILLQLTPAPTPAFLRVRPPEWSASVTGFVAQRAHWLWMTQALLQLSSLGAALLLAPTYFRLLMPRALFGCLLAWTTIVITALPDLKDMGGGGVAQTFGRACHQALIGQEVIYSVLIGLGIFLLSSIFVAYTITQFITSWPTVLRRTLRTAGGLLGGAFFWSMLFALPAKYILESDVVTNAFVIDCFSVIPIVVIGTPVAVLFGLIVQLIWEDASLTEPIGEPL